MRSTDLEDKEEFSLFLETCVKYITRYKIERYGAMSCPVQLLASGRWPYQYLFFQVVLFNSKSKNQGLLGHRKLCLSLPLTHRYATTKEIDLGQGIETLEISTIFLFCRSPMIRF